MRVTMPEDRGIGKADSTADGSGTAGQCGGDGGKSGGSGRVPPRAGLGWLELGCWTMVALAPFLYWVNGPAVSTDQFVVRTTVVMLALVGGIAIRVYRW